MAYLFSDGLDGQGDLPDRWAVRQPEATLSAGTGKFGGGSLAFTGIAGNGAALITPTFPQPTTARGSTGNPAHASFYFKSSTLPASNKIIAVFRDDQQGAYVSLIVGTGGGITATQSENIPATLSPVTAPTGPNLFDGNWHHIEAKISVHATSGNATIWVDNAKVVDYSGDMVASRDLGATGISSFSVDSPNTASNMDDVLVWDQEGTDFTVSGQFGAHRIATIIPDGDGASTQFTPTGAGTTNADRVDEALADDDTTYVESATSGHKDLYTYSSMPTGLDTIHGVAVHTRAKNDDIGLIQASAVARSGTFETNGTTYSVSSGGIYGNNTHFYPLDPDGGGAWTETRINAAQFGIRVV